MEATRLRQTFTVLTVRVLYRGCAIPVAWVSVPTTATGAWQPHWLGRLALIDAAIPTSGWGLVLADRGRYAKWLYQASRKHDWHPFRRINAQGP